MFYYEGLEEVIFGKHEFGSDEPDELIIISGYLGPSPLERLKDLDFKVTVVGGMYKNGMNANLFNSLEKIKEENENLEIVFSNVEIHSKIYIWKKNGRILSALIGSANFSSNGLRTDYRESLAEVTRASFPPLDRYFKSIYKNSSTKPNITNKPEIIDISIDSDSKLETAFEMKYSCNMPLYSHTKEKGNHVPSKSGLNWGFSRGHVAEGDAYIKIPKNILKENQNLIDPFDIEYETPEGKRKRNSDPIELIWDDGTTMEASFEGEQTFRGLTYPKQIASFSSKTPYLDGKRISKKSILGRYLRKRMNVSLNHSITIEDLKNYGRCDITLSFIEEGMYYADFSVPK